MIILKSTHKKLIAEKDIEIIRLKKKLKDIEYFAEIGVKSAQQILRGYKFIDLSYWPKSAFFPVFVKKFTETKGTTHEKLSQFLNEIHKKTNYWLCKEINCNDKKTILEKLKIVTNYSETGGLK